MFFNKKIGGSDSGGAEGKEVSIELILAAGIDRGLRMEDTERMTVGMWIDYIVEWNELHDRKDEKKEETRKATQADFDRF